MGMRTFQEERYRPFVREIEEAAGSRRNEDALFDAVRMMALSIQAAVSLDATEAEREFQTIRGRFSDAEYAHVTAAFGKLVIALEEDRTEFLGHVMERCFEATNRGNGQFLTPPHIADLIGRMLAGRPDGGVARLNDPCCGCGVLLIQGAEAFMENGWRQSDLLIDAGDIDLHALDMCYVQLSLLGYAAVVRHQDALSRKKFSADRFTPGWFIHGFPLRGIKA